MARARAWWAASLRYLGRGRESATPHNDTRVPDMSANRQKASSTAVGVDVGGTWVRVLGRRDGHIVLRARTSAKSVPELGTFLRNVFPRLQRPGALVVASRGVWTAAERRRLAVRLQGLAARVRVISDAEAALLGALGHRPGVLVLAGTGSIVLACDTRGNITRAGGLGPLLGDEGSAFWLGREWLRATARRGNITLARNLGRAPDGVAKIARLAPAVIARARAGDARARRIVREAQRHLAELAITVARRSRLRPPIAVSWAGTLLENDWFRRGVGRALARSSIRATWTPPAADAVTAAAELAETFADAHASPSARRRTVRVTRRR